MGQDAPPCVKYYRSLSYEEQTQAIADLIQWLAQVVESDYSNPKITELIDFLQGVSFAMTPELRGILNALYAKNPSPRLLHRVLCFEQRTHEPQIWNEYESKVLDAVEKDGSYPLNQILVCDLVRLMGLDYRLTLVEIVHRTIVLENQCDVQGAGLYALFHIEMNVKCFPSSTEEITLQDSDIAHLNQIIADENYSHQSKFIRWLKDLA